MSVLGIALAGIQIGFVAFAAWLPYTRPVILDPETLFGATLFIVWSALSPITFLMFAALIVCGAFMSASLP